MSSDTDHGPVTIFGPFIPIIVSRNSTFLLLKKKRGFWFLGDYFPHTYVISFCAGVLSTAKRHAPDLRHSGRFNIYFIRRLVPHVLWYDGDPMMEKFYGDLGWNSLAYFSHPYINCSNTLGVPLFASSTLKNQSEEPFYIFVSNLLVFLLSFKTLSSLAF